MGVRSLVTVTDPFAVLGVAPDASRREVQAARRALVKRLHPDVRGEDDPKVRAHAERRLAEVNAAYDAVVTGWLSSGVEDPAAASTPVSFAVGAFRPVAFEAIMVASADLGDVTDADEPFSLELFVEGPPRGFCRLELFPEAGGSVVTADSDDVDAAVVCRVLVAALRHLGVAADLLPA
jgi:hypothetical protein